MSHSRWLVVALLLTCFSCSDDAPTPGSSRSSGGAPSGEGSSGGEPPQEVKPLQDAGALALIDQGDVQIYMASQAGLKDVTYEQTLDGFPGVSFSVRWVAPDHADVRMQVLDDRMQAWARENGQQKMSEVLDLHELIVGKTNRSQYEDDEIRLEGPNKVTIIAKSQQSMRRFTRTTTTFDGRGLPVTSEHHLTNGNIVTQTTSFRPGPDGRYLIDRVDSVLKQPEKETRSTMVFTYEVVSGYTLASRISVTNANGEKHGSTFRDYAVDRGLRAEEIR